MDGIDREVGEVKSKVDALCAAFQDFRDESRRWQERCDVEFQTMGTRFIKQIEQQSNRLSALEQWRSWLAGGLAMLGMLWAAVWFWMKR